MKRSRAIAVLCVTGGLLAGVATVSSGSAETGSKAGTAAEKLRQRVERLETRVAQLERQLRRQKAERGILKQRLQEALLGRRLHVVPAPQGTPKLVPKRAPGVPDTWKRNEINGIPYYIVPLDDRGKND